MMGGNTRAVMNRPLTSGVAVCIPAAGAPAAA